MPLNRTRVELQMNSKEWGRLRAEGLSLEPIETAGTTSAPASKDPAQFRVNTRGKSDRRKGAERRETLRFQDDRRKTDRRPRKSWESGKNL